MLASIPFAIALSVGSDTSVRCISVVSSLDKSPVANHLRQSPQIPRMDRGLRRLTWKLPNWVEPMVEGRRRERQGRCDARRRCPREDDD